MASCADRSRTISSMRGSLEVSSVTDPVVEGLGSPMVDGQQGYGVGHGILHLGGFRRSGREGRR